MKYLFDGYKVGGYTGEVMRRIIQVRVTKGDNQYVAECLDLPVVTQAKTLDELVKNINEALALHFEGEDFAQLDFIKDPSVLASLELEPFSHAGI